MRKHIPDNELLQALDGELLDSRRLAVEWHARWCESCSDRLRAMRESLSVATTVCREVAPRDTKSLEQQRAVLARRLTDAGHRYDRSWVMRLERAIDVRRPGVMLGVALVVAGVLYSAGLVDLGSRATPTAGPGSAVLPIAAFTPGATSTLTTVDLCSGARPSRVVSADVRLSVLRRYDMTSASPDTYELDALITPELGGTTASENLWPQRYDARGWNARTKDKLEQLLPPMVCRGEITLAQAQLDIATDWIAAYQRYFKTSVPLSAHLESAAEDDDLLFEPVIFATEISLLMPLTFDPIPIR